MKRYIRELIQAAALAALFALPFAIYFWSMKP